MSDVKVGITLPSFREELGPSLAVTAAAEASGLDGVFAYDHLFRRDRDGNRRPALEMFALLGAIASASNRIAIGSLVARATLRPYATLANG
ncbi:MAG TPA: LLM class flavin-dependent oxidoreductase, partial [Solirubrobacteraceae bacterium]